MRILLTADAELPVPPRLYGGIERIIASLVKEFRRRGHQVALVAHRESTVPNDAFFPWPTLSSTRAVDHWRNGLALRKAVSAFQPDVVHSFSRLLWLLPLLPSSVPRIMSYQRAPTGRTVAWSDRLHGRRLHFTGCSEHIAAQGRRSRGEWSAIPNFIDPEKFTFEPTVAADAPFVFLSRIERIKGTHNAIAIARASGRRLLIAGNRVTSPEGEKYWCEQVAPHLDSSDIEYVGPVDDAQKNSLLGQAAAMVVPIEWDEPFGIVFAESLACGTPVISTRRGSVPEIVRDGVTGLILDDVSQAADLSPHLPRLDRAACRNDAESRFGLEVCADRYLELYESMLRGEE